MNTTYFLNCIAGNLFHTKTEPTIPENYYLGLSTSEPAMDGSGVTEPPESANYQRILLSGLSQPVDGEITNESDISFPESSGDWGTVTHYIICDSPTVGEGNLLIYGELSTPRHVEAETAMIFKTGRLELLTQNPAS